jgi:hypothetical protein
MEIISAACRENTMIQDIAEGLSKAIFKGVSRFVLEILVEFLFFYTGEIVLFIMTLGKKKPRWDYCSDESPSKWVIFSELSTWIGIAFWLFVAWFINSVLLS